MPKAYVVFCNFCQVELNRFVVGELNGETLVGVTPEKLQLSYGRYMTHLVTKHWEVVMYTRRWAEERSMPDGHSPN